MGIMDAFFDWKVNTAQLEQLVTSRNADGTISSAYSSVGSPFPVGQWIDTLSEDSENNVFTNQELGTIIADPADVSTVPKKGDKLTINGVEYWVIGTDQSIAELNEVLMIKVRREYGR